jgi:DNA-binding response OmpR family regulator
MPEQILLVDDEPSLRRSLGYTLTRSGFEVQTAADGPSALLAVRRAMPDLVLLDVMLPGLDGFEVCRRLRARTNAPIVMLTARDDPVDRVVGLEVGADDYVTKPFSMRELVARVRAHLRRDATVQAAVGAPVAADDRAEVLAVGELRVDVGARRVSLGGRPLPLRRREFDLLTYMVRNAGIVLSRARLVENVWDGEVEEGTRTVDVHVRRLRRHLQADAESSAYLHTVRGMGYVLRRPSSS